MGKDNKRKGAYIALRPGVRELLDGICGLKGTTRTEYIGSLVEKDIVATYNAMENRDAVLDAQQAIARTNPPLPSLYNKLNERVGGVANPQANPVDEEEEDETY